jgi:hypothetical protein
MPLGSNIREAREKLLFANLTRNLTKPAFV